MQATVNGHRMHWVEAGDPKGPPIILVHGFPFTHAMWGPQLDALKKAGWRAIAYDVRGHGGSAAGDGQYLLETFVDDLLGLMDHLKLDTAAWCGLSMGGYVVLRALERAPERCRAAVLADTRSEADADATKLRRAEVLRSLPQAGVKAFAEGFLKTVFAPENIERRPEAVELIRRLIEGNTVLGIKGALLALAGRTDTTAALASIRIPTLVLVGEKDALTPPALAEALAAKIPGATLARIPGAGHMSNLEGPDAFNSALLGFLKGLPEERCRVS